MGTRHLIMVVLDGKLKKIPFKKVNEKAIQDLIDNLNKDNKKDK